jgi:hypothetical protein
MPERHKRQKLVILSQEKKERLEEEAREKNVSESEILRRAVDLYFAREDRIKRRKAS